MDNENNGKEISGTANQTNDHMSVSSTDRPLLTYKERVARARQFQEEEQRKKLDDLQKSLKKIEDARAKVNLDRQRKIDEIKRRDDEHRRKVNERRLEREKINLEKINRIMERSQERNAKKNSNIMLASCYVPGSQANKVNITREASNNRSKGYYMTVGRDDRINGIGNRTNSSQSLTRLNSRSKPPKLNEKPTTGDIPRAQSALSFAQPTKAFLNKINNNSNPSSNNPTISPRVPYKRRSSDESAKKPQQIPVRPPLAVKKKLPRHPPPHIDRKQHVKLVPQKSKKIPNSSNTTNSMKDLNLEEHTDTINDIESLDTTEGSMKINASSVSELKTDDSYDKLISKHKGSRDSLNSDDLSLNHKLPEESESRNQSGNHVEESEEKHKEEISPRVNGNSKPVEQEKFSPDIPLRKNKRKELSVEAEDNSAKENTPHRNGPKVPPADSLMTQSVYTKFQTEITGGGEGNDLSDEAKQIYQARMAEMRRLAKEKKAEEERLLREKKAEEQKKMEEFRRIRAKERAEAEIKARAIQEEQEQKEREEREKIAEEQARIENERRQKEEEAERAKKEADERERREKEEREQREKEERKKKLANIMTRVKGSKPQTPTSHRNSVSPKTGDNEEGSGHNGLLHRPSESYISHNDIPSDGDAFSTEESNSIFEKENNLQSQMNNNNNTSPEKSTKTTFQHPLLKAMQDRGRLNAKTTVDLFKKNIEREQSSQEADEEVIQ